jgi:hypothetical protein
MPSSGITHQDVGDAEQRDHLRAPVRPVHRIRDVDVHLHPVVEPVVAEAARALLEELRRGDRRPQLLLTFRDRLLHLSPLVSAGEPDPGAQRILQECHPDAAAVGLVEVLVQEDHEGGELPGGVVAAHAVDQGIQVAVEDLGVAELVWIPGAVHTAEVVDPQDVVILGFADLPQQLPLELLVDDVVVLVAAGEALADGALEQRVELRLGVVLFGAEPELERNPDQLGGLPVAGRPGTVRLDGVEEGLEHVEDRIVSLGRYAGAGLQPDHEPVVGVAGKAPRRVRLLDPAQQEVVGKDQLVEQDASGARRDLAPLRRCLTRPPPGRAVADCEREGPLELGVVDANLFRIEMPLRVQGVALGHVRLEALDPIREALETVLAAAAGRVEEGRREAIDPVGRVLDVREHLVESGIGGCEAQRRLLWDREGDVVRAGPGAPHPRLPQGKAEAELECLPPGGEPVDAKPPAEAKEPTAPERVQERQDQVGGVVADVVVDAEGDAERTQRDQAAHAAVDLGTARPDVALARDADGRDRARDVLE